jgi:hypothetical protein
LRLSQTYRIRRPRGRLSAPWEPVIGWLRIRVWRIKEIISAAGAFPAPGDRGLLRARAGVQKSRVER